MYITTINISIKYWLSILLFFLSISIYGQKYVFKQYTTKDGLSHNDVSRIIQASDHKIWVATTGGLSCFNGSYFKNYNTENGLSSNNIQTVFEDSKGRVWVGTYDKGASYIENGIVINLTNIHENGQFQVTDFLEAEDGTIYMFCQNAIIKYKDGQHEVVNSEHPEENKIKCMNAMWYDSNTIYIATYTKGVAKVTLKPYKVEYIGSKSHDINNVSYYVNKDSQGNVWIGTYGELVKIDDSWNIEKFKFNNKFYHKNRVFSFYHKNENEVVVAFEGRGFGILNKKTKKYKIFNEENGLPTPNIYSILVDNEQNIWMGTSGQGIVKYNNSAFQLFDESIGLPSSEVNSVVPNGDNSCFLATNNGLANLNFKTNEIKILNNRIIKSIAKVDDQYWYSTLDSVFSITSGYKQKYLWDGHYGYIYNDSVNTFLYGYQHFYVKDKNRVFKILKKYKGNQFKGISPINENYLFAFEDEIYLYNNDTINKISNEFNDSSLFTSLEAVSKNEVLIAENTNGIKRVTFKDSIFKVKHYQKSKFKNLKNLKALKVNGNDLWLGDENVILKVDLQLLLDKDSVSMKTYPIDKSFYNGTITSNNIKIADNENILITTSVGLLVFDENEYNESNKPPNISLSEVLLYTKPLPDSLYKKTATPVELSYDQNFLTFSMEAITFSNPENVHYKYRLKGLNNREEWSLPSKNSKVVYSYLPTGDYVFEFTADNGNGDWQEKTNSFNFVIKAPFWRNSLFWLGAILIISALTVYIIYLRNNIQKRKLEKFSQDLIVAQEEERTRVSKDLHDGLGQQLTLIKKKAQNLDQHELSSMTNSALEEVRSISRALYPSYLKKLGLSESIEQLLYDLDEETKMFFSVEIDNINDLFKEEQSLNFYRFIQEAVNNVIKHSNAKTLIVNVVRKKYQVKVLVKDNGLGFEDVQGLKNKSLGLKTMVERIRILRGELTIESQLNKGTKIEVKIPV